MASAQFDRAEHARASASGRSRSSNCIIAAGSEAATLPGLPDDPRVIDSTGALSPSRFPKRLLVIGGGIIGLEMATVYDALGSRVTVVELIDQLIPGLRPGSRQAAAEADLGALRGDPSRRPRSSSVKAQKSGLKVTFSSGSTRSCFDRVLVAVGRRPNGARDRRRARPASPSTSAASSPSTASCAPTSPGIYAIGDVVGGPMLAHKASHEGKVAAEVIAGPRASSSTRARSRRSPTPTPRSRGWG